MSGTTIAEARKRYKQLYLSLVQHLAGPIYDDRSESAIKQHLYQGWEQPLKLRGWG